MSEEDDLKAKFDRMFKEQKFDPRTQDSGKILNPPGLTVEKITEDYAGFVEGRPEYEMPCWAPLIRGWRKRLAENPPPQSP